MTFVGTGTPHTGPAAAQGESTLPPCGAGPTGGPEVGHVHYRELIHFAVERPESGVCVVRVIGTLTRETTPMLLSLLERAARDDSTPVADLVVDLEGVCVFGVDCLAGLRDAWSATAEDADRPQLHLCGLGDREHQLPLRVADTLSSFSRFRTVEHAVARLGGSAHFAQATAASPPGPTTCRPEPGRAAQRGSVRRSPSPSTRIPPVPHVAGTTHGPAATHVPAG
ncbi:hypothetical protein GCM10023175_32300 [Pseudonocardia xishanensis]|uniref:STAS domain-containing protein n=1 Tax=Pseudonocardia xishanensis TaxID=630995 RepID=A0ABP8RSQ7_9PSEU